MLRKAPILPISQFKIQFTPQLIPNIQLLQNLPHTHPTPISSYQISNHPQFQRHFTKSAPPPNEQSILDETSSLLRSQPPKTDKAIYLLKKLADSGSVRGMLAYAGLCENVTNDIAEATTYYARASQTDDASPEATLAYMQHLQRVGKTAELDLLKKSIMDGTSGARVFALGVVCLHEDKLGESVAVLNRAVDLGSVDAMVLQASLVVKDKPEDSLSLLKKAIACGSHVAMYGYASYLAKGEFRELFKGRDEERAREAMRYMKEAAEGGVKDAVLTVAEWLFNGFCGERDVEKAMIYYRRAADVYDDPVGQYVCGVQLLKKDGKTAVEYLKKSALKKFPDAMYKLGFLCMSGTAVKKDIEEANRYFREAAESEDADGDMVTNFALRLLVGEGIKKDVKEAERFLKKGADAGHKMCIQFLKSLKDNK